MLGLPLLLKRRCGRDGAREMGSLARHQALRAGPQPEQLHGLGNTRQVGLHDGLEIADLPLPPALDRAGIEPSDPDEHVDGARIFLGRKGGLGRPDHPIVQLLAIARIHGVAVDGLLLTGSKIVEYVGRERKPSGTARPCGPHPGLIRAWFRVDAPRARASESAKPPARKIEIREAIQC